MRVTAPEAPDVQVDVKLVDRAGSVRVAVRTADAGMAQDLRSGLTDLVHRLEHKGFEAETWSPASNPGRAYSNAAQQERDATQDNPGGARHGSPQHDNGQQPGGRNRPRWVAELEQRLEGERE